VKIYHLGHAAIPGDAVTTHTFEIDRRLRAWGFETEAFAQHVGPEFRDLARPDVEFLPYLDRKDDLLIYHYSIYTPNVRLFRAFQGPKILIYHNITPSRFFRRWDRRQAWLCEMGRRALTGLRACTLALGVSEYNRMELVEAGFPSEHTGVLPIFLQVEDFDRVETNGCLLGRLRADDTVNFLSVGRIVPNKAVEDVVRIFYLYHRYINSHSHLFLVGSRYLPTYDAQIDGLVEALGISDSVTLTGRIPLVDLKTYYQAAHLYLTASYHEGFCVPLLESMYFGVAIIARQAAAVPETLGDTGVLFTRLGYVEVAEMAHLLLTDAELQARVIAAQRERLAAFAPSRVEEHLRAALRRVGVAGLP
jgi:glycosyltransferase involved in cell wall biosynthesis